MKRLCAVSSDIGKSDWVLWKRLQAPNRSVYPKRSRTTTIYCVSRSISTCCKLLCMDVQTQVANSTKICRATRRSTDALWVPDSICYCDIGCLRYFLLRSSSEIVLLQDI